MLKLLPILLIGFFLQEEAQAQCDTSFTTSISGATLQLHAADSSPYKVHQWRFGDGAQAWGANVYHTYSAPGTYVVWHFVTDSLSTCHDSAQRTITISFPAGCFDSAFFFTTPAGSNPLKINFTASPADPALSYTWHFGDGQMAIGQSPIHLYGSPGTYYVTLFVADSVKHCYDSVSRNILIQGPAQDTCTASFTYTANPSQPNQLTFTAISNRTIVSQYWFIRPCDSLANPSTDSLVYNTPNPVHLFTNPGCYQVCVSLLTSTGCRKNYCDTLVIQNTGSKLLTSFPNPASGSEVNIQLNMEQPGKVKLSVVNSYGNVVYTNEKVYGAGQNRIGIPVNKLQRGMYFVDIQYGNIRKRSVFQKL